mgnify:FL=1
MTVPLSRPGLTGNQLKIIALISMTIDHIGMQLFPRVGLLRILGRLAFPIFAFMIAEGCCHTRNRKKYLLSMASLAALCQLVYLLAMGSVYMSVLVTFSLSILLVYAIDFGKKLGGAAWLVSLTVFTAIYFLTEILPLLLRSTDYGIDYGFWGVLLPVVVYLAKDRPRKLLMAALALCMIAIGSSPAQWWGLSAIPLLALYNGKRGKRKMKYLFYVYYPAHLVVIHLLSYMM